MPKIETARARSLNLTSMLALQDVYFGDIVIPTGVHGEMFCMQLATNQSPALATGRLFVAVTALEAVDPAFSMAARNAGHATEWAVIICDTQDCPQLAPVWLGQKGKITLHKPEGAVQRIIGKVIKVGPATGDPANFGKVLIDPNAIHLEIDHEGK